jgi:hypothetical protein
MQKQKAVWMPGKERPAAARLVIQKPPTWIRMLIFNEHEDERVFDILDKHWEQVHATFQIRMAGYSGLRVQ